MKFITKIQEEKNVKIFEVFNRYYHPQSGFLGLLVTEAGIRTLFVVPGIVFNKLIFVVRTAQILHITFESMEQDFTLNWTQTDHHTPNFTFTGGKGTLW